MVKLNTSPLLVKSRNFGAKVELAVKYSHEHVKKHMNSILERPTSHISNNHFVRFTDPNRFE